MIVRRDQVIRRSGKRWVVVTEDPVLAPFLAPGGDYRVLVNYPGILDEQPSNSGNVISWRVDGDTVSLAHADTDRGPVCEIRRSVLEEVVALLAETRDAATGTKSRAKRKAKRETAKRETRTKRATARKR